MAGGDGGHRGVDGGVDGGGVAQGTLVQSAERPAAHAGALPGAQRHLDGDVFGPAVTELPGLLTRSVMAAGRLPDGPSTVRSWSLIESASTGPNGL